MSYPYSSTQLRQMIDHCPKAMDYAEQYGDDNPIYDVGVVAHAVIEAVIKARATSEEQINAISEEIAFKMMSEGYAYNGKQQPPRNPESTFQGVELAIHYLFVKGLDISKDAQAEVKLGMTTDLNPCDYNSPACAFRATIDLITPSEIGDEEFHATGYNVCDWKSSWQADEKELHTLQRKAQAVLVWLHYPAQFITQQIVNLRTHATYENQIFLDEAGIEQLTKWAKEILLVCQAAERPRQARQGVGCLTCSHISVCEYTNVQPEKDIATTLTVAKAKYDNLLIKAKARIKTTETINNGIVGWHLKNGSKPINNAHQLLLKNWPNNDVSSLLSALKLGVTNYKNLAKQLYKNKEERQVFLEQVLSENPIPYFGIKKSLK